jgi:hypothetical protein
MTHMTKRTKRVARDKSQRTAKNYPLRNANHHSSRQVDSDRPVLKSIVLVKTNNQTKCQQRLGVAQRPQVLARTQEWRSSGLQLSDNSDVLCLQPPPPRCRSSCSSRGRCAHVCLHLRRVQKGGGHVGHLILLLLLMLLLIGALVLHLRLVLWLLFLLCMSLVVLLLLLTVFTCKKNRIALYRIQKMIDKGFKFVFRPPFIDTMNV